MSKSHFLCVAAVCLLSLQTCAQANSSTTSAPTTTSKQPTTTTTSATSKTSERQQNGTSPPAKPLEPTSRPGPRAAGRRSNLECDYQKGPWEECKGNVQQRTLRLRNATSASKCEPIKLMRRECKLVAGCKYLRGRWSATCSDGLRLRIDTLVAPAGNSAGPQACQPIRRVVKDCKRACHYIKNPWGECVNGFKTRNLTLQEPPAALNPEQQSHIKSPLLGNSSKPDLALPVASENQMLGLGCAREKMIKKECRARNLMRQRNSNGTSSLVASAYNKNNNSLINNNNNKTQAVRLTAAQKRRLKQLQKQQQQQQQQQLQLQQRR